jgi:formylglycine-generating enzyme required for sulfatase activity
VPVARWFAMNSCNAAIVLLLVSITVFGTGCGSGRPDVAIIKNRMSPEQLAISDPLVNQVDMIMVPIPAGQFLMGTRAKPQGKEPTKGGPESPQHRVKITQPFYMSAFEITQKQYEQVMGERPWDGQPLVENGPDNAATYITWNMAAEFCKNLGELENEQYRLPTEAEWEYACRAGSQTNWSFGDDHAQLNNHAWIDANSYQVGEQYAHRVGQKLPNNWALYDMHGNTWEWCQDWYGPYNGRQLVNTDPTGPKNGRVRIWRGGSFSSAALNTRAASRVSWGRVGYRPEYLTGFRVVKSTAVTNTRTDK